MYCIEKVNHREKKIREENERRAWMRMSGNRVANVKEREKAKVQMKQNNSGGCNECAPETTIWGMARSLTVRAKYLASSI